MKRVECPICLHPLKDDERLVLSYYAPKNWWVINHYRPPKAGETPLPDGFVLHCGVAGQYEPILIYGHVEEIKERAELLNSCKELLSLDAERSMGEVPRARWLEVRARAEAAIAKAEAGFTERKENYENRRV